MSTIARHLHGLLARRVDGASLALFRIAFGLVVVWHAARYLWPTPYGNMLEWAFVEPNWNFPYPGFEWVRPWPEPFLTIHFVSLALAGLCLALGFFYRTAAITVFLGLTYVFLLEEATYLNHVYLMCLLALLLAWMPGQACFSIDRWRSAPGEPDDNPPGSIPFWPVFLLRAQLFLVYFYAGVAKLNPDWVSGRPLWATGNRVLEALSGWLSPAATQSIQAVVDYQDIARWLAVGGLGFDLAIGFLLLCRRTRLLAIVLLLMFHTFNHHAFSIGVFPVMAFTATLIFFEPDWPRVLGRWIKRPRISRPDLGWMIGGAVIVPLLGAALGWKRRAPARWLPAAPHRHGPLVSVLVFVWLMLHVLLPLRHYAIPGDAQWTEEGHRFSWRMMLRSKTGYLRLRVFDPALLVTDATGVNQINWSEWTKHYRKILHVNVDVHQVDWQQMPKLVVLFEPQLGERIVLSPRSRRHASPQAALRWLKQHWQDTYGRQPQVVSTTTIAEALDAIRRDVQARMTARPSGESEKAFLAQLDQTIRCAATAPQTAIDQELKPIELNERCGVLAGDPTFGPIVRRHLGRTHPFSLQGRRHRGLPFYVVEDPELIRPNRRRVGQLNRKLWKDTHLVYFDRSRIRRDAWLDLPQVLIYYHEGGPQVEWNHQGDLSPKQVQKLATWPYMIHQYAQRIAGLWEARFGRRPQLYAATSLVMLNSRRPQTLIDPRVDLAGTPLKLLGHNHWILPFRYDEPMASPLQLAQASDPKQLEPRYAEGNAAAPSETTRVVRRYPNGQPMVKETVSWRDGKRHSTTTIWNEDGRISMRAEYLGGVQHGTATKWHSNGQLAMRVNYRHGERHGEATTWYENGQLSWQGRFVHGRRDGVATAWYAQGGKAAQGQFREGKKTGWWTTWDERGGQARRCQYHDGQRATGSADPDVVKQGVHELVGNELR